MTKAREFAAAWAKNPPKTREEFIALKDAHQGTMDMQKKVQIDFPDESFVILRIPCDGTYAEINKVFDAPGIKVMHDSDDEIKPPKTLAGEFMAEVGNLLMTRGLLNTMLKKHNATRRHDDTTVFFSDGSGIFLKANDDNRWFVEKEITPEPEIDNKPLPTSWGANWPESHITQTATNETEHRVHAEILPRVEIDEDFDSCYRLTTAEGVFLGYTGHWWRADSREGVGDALQKTLDAALATLLDSQTGRHDTGDNVRHPAVPTNIMGQQIAVHHGTVVPKTEVSNPDPRWMRRVCNHAMQNPTMTESEMLDMFADEANWKQIYQDGRCYWSWIGPVLPPWQWIQHAREITKACEEGGSDGQ